jgi:hypothetical protein
MSDRVTSLALTLFLLVLLGAMTWMAFDFNVQARRVPLVVGIPTTIGLAVQLLREFLAFRLGPEVSDAQAAGGADMVQLPEGVGSEATDASAESERAPSTTKSERAEIPAPKASAVQAFGWILALGFSFYLLGMLATVPLFVGSFMRIYGGESWKIVLASVAGTMAVLYLLFVRLLEVRLYTGLVFDWLDL